MAVAIGVPKHLKKKPVVIEEQNKRRGWITPYGFIDMKEPCTHEEACAEMEKLRGEFFNVTE